MFDNIANSLLTPQALIYDDHAWRYQAPTGFQTGHGRLRVWTTEEAPLLGMITECGIGQSVMNAAEDIQRRAREQFSDSEMIVLEHWPAGSGLDPCDTIDYVTVEDGEVQWNRISPIGYDDPQRKEWMRVHGARLLAEGGPWVPQPT